MLMELKNINFKVVILKKNKQYIRAEGFDFVYFCFSVDIV